MVRTGGKIIQIANLEGLLELDPVLMRSKNISLVFPSGGGAEALRYAAFLVATKRVKVEPQISHVMHGLEKVPEAMEITANKVKYRATNPVQIVV